MSKLEEKFRWTNFYSDNNNIGSVRFVIMILIRVQHDQ